MAACPADGVVDDPLYRRVVAGARRPMRDSVGGLRRRQERLLDEQVRRVDHTRHTDGRHVAVGRRQSTTLQNQTLTD